MVFCTGKLHVSKKEVFEGTCFRKNRTKKHVAFVQRPVDETVSLLLNI